MDAVDKFLAGDLGEAPAAAAAPPGAAAMPAAGIDPAAPAAAAPAPAGAPPAQPATEAQGKPPGVIEKALDMIKDPREAAHLSFGVAVALGNGVMHVKEGLWSAGLDTLEKVGAVPRGTSDDFARMSNAERAKMARDFASVFGEGAGFRIAEGTGEVLPFMMFPPTALPAGVTSAVARVAAGLGLGGAMGAAQGWLGGVGSEDQIPENMDDRMAARTQGAIVGGAIGAPLGAVTEGATVLKTWVPNAIKKAYEANRGLYAEGVEVSKRTGVRYKLSQLLQDPEIDALERTFRGGLSGERTARNIEMDQAEQAKAYFQSLLKPQDKRLGVSVKEAFDEVLGDTDLGTGLLGQRRLEGMRNFKTATDAGAEVYMENTLTEIDDMLVRYMSPGATDGEKALAKQLQSFRNSVALEGGGRLTPEQLQWRLESWGAAAKGNGKVFDETVHMAAERTPAKRIFSALNADLDLAITQGFKGAKELRYARDQYARSTAAITELEDSALGKLFGDGVDHTVEGIHKAILNMDPTELRQTIGVLGRVDGEARERFQQFYLSQAFESASKLGPAGSSDFIPAKMMDMRQPGGKNAAYGARDVFEAVFPDSKQRQQVEDGIRAVQFLMVNNNTTGGQNVVRLRNLAYALTNMNKGAAASFATQMLAPKVIGSYVLDASAVEALKQLTKPLNYSQTLGALTVLSNRWLASNPNAGAQVPEAQDGEAYTQ